MSHKVIQSFHAKIRLKRYVMKLYIPVDYDGIFKFNMN